MKFDSVRDVLDNYDIEVDPKKSNAQNYLVRCPFHLDKNPSLSIRKDNGLFLCFACGESGSIIKFIMKLEECDYTTAKRLWEGDEEILKLGTEKEEETDFNSGFFDLLKTLNTIFFQTEPQIGLAFPESDSYIVIDEEKRKVFLKLEKEILESWFYFGYVKDPYFHLLEIKDNYEEIIKEIKGAFLINGGHKDTGKLNL